MTYQLGSWFKKKKNTEALCWQKAEKLEFYKGKKRLNSPERLKKKKKERTLETFNDSQNIYDVAFIGILSFREDKAPKIPRG